MCTTSVLFKKQSHYDKIHDITSILKFKLRKLSIENTFIIFKLSSASVR